MFYEAVSSEQLDLLNKFSDIKEITDSFYLAGGTAMALQLGHRKSDDFDFFCSGKFNSEIYSDIIINNFGGTVTYLSPDTVTGVISKTSISFFLYPYKLIREFKKYENINLANLEDLACMKFKALSQRGAKRDFYDIFEFLKRIQPLELKNYMIEKFNLNGNSFYHLARCLVYFEDAERDPDPISLNGTTWDTVKSYLIKNQHKILKAFV